jgi:hypothetical protein
MLAFLLSLGLNGSDVAKGAADIVLADDNFATIVRAIKKGRGVLTNLSKVWVSLVRPPCSRGKRLIPACPLLFSSSCSFCSRATWPRSLFSSSVLPSKTNRAGPSTLSRPSPPFSSIRSQLVLVRITHSYSSYQPSIQAT